MGKVEGYPRAERIAMEETVLLGGPTRAEESWSPQQWTLEPEEWPPDTLQCALPFTSCWCLLVTGRHGRETHRDPCLHFIACWCENKPNKSDLREKGLISLMIPGYSPSLWGSHSVGIQSSRHITPTVESQEEQMKTSVTFSTLQSRIPA